MSFTSFLFFGFTLAILLLYYLLPHRNRKLLLLAASYVFYLCSADWYDSIHFNRFGAMKLTDFLADYMLSCGIQPGEQADRDLWARRVAYLDGVEAP